MNNWKKIIGYFFASLLIVFVVLYWIIDIEWARKPFELCLCVVCLYNLFLNPVNRNKSNDLFERMFHGDKIPFVFLNHPLAADLFLFS